jgi:two-component system cell cycle response regulator
VDARAWAGDNPLYEQPLSTGGLALIQEDDKPLPPSRVLVVDDNAQNLELLTAYMEEVPNVTISAATNGAEALAKVGREPPDLILLDIMMPKMSGFEVCRQLKSDPQTRDIQIVMVTALNEVGDHERAVDCGTDEFLTKPVNRIELITRVKSLLRHRHLKRELQQTLDALHSKASGISPENS